MTFAKSRRHTSLQSIESVSVQNRIQAERGLMRRKRFETDGGKNVGKEKRVKMAVSKKQPEKKRQKKKSRKRKAACGS